MRIPFESIPEGISNLELKCGIEELNLEAEEVRFMDPVNLALDLFKYGDKVFVKARLSVDIEAECARCLNIVHQTLESSSENQYRPLPKTPQYLLDDIGIRYYTEEYIDLSEDIRESIILELPVKILCSENCKGLCPHCGQNLNEGKCKCKPEPEETKVSKFADLVRMIEKGKLEV